MADPHATIAGALTGAGISSVTIVLGAQVDALVVGLISAVLVSSWLESIDSRIKAAGAVMFSAMLAAYGSPVAAGLLVSEIPAIATNSDSLRLLLAVGIGGLVPSLWPLVIKFFGNKINRCKI